MSQRKVSTPRARAATQRKTTPRSELAQLLSQVLTHPELPVTLYDAITDVLLDMASEIEYDKAEMIEISLNAFERREEKRQGGAR